MLERQESLPYIEDIRNHINQTLCEIEQLKPNIFELSEATLWRGGKPCGMTFCLCGPRSVRLTAVWETDGDTILFYGSEGERVQRTHLQNAPSIQPVANQQSIANAA